MKPYVLIGWRSNLQIGLTSGVVLRSFKSLARSGEWSSRCKTWVGCILTFVCRVVGVQRDVDRSREREMALGLPLFYMKWEWPLLSADIRVLF
jgi:hypothetical protein